VFSVLCQSVAVDSRLLRSPNCNYYNRYLAMAFGPFGDISHSMGKAKPSGNGFAIRNSHVLHDTAA